MMDPPLSAQALVTKRGTYQQLAIAVVGLVLLSSSAHGAQLQHLQQDQQPLKLTFYMESLCPYCREFTLTGLTRLFSSGVSDLVDITVVPWGNARFNEANRTWTCQHGPLECVYNSVLSCALHKYPKQDDWFPYLACLEKDLGKGGAEEWSREVHRRCAQQAGFDEEVIWDCAFGAEGQWLQNQARLTTDALDPPHLGVPWVTLTGKGGNVQPVPLYDAQSYIRTVVCAAYAGPNTLPTDCYKEEVPECSLRKQSGPRMCLRDASAAAGSARTAQQQQQAS